MHSIFIGKLKEVLISVLPIVALVTLLHWTLTPLATSTVIKFYIGACLIIIGLSLFLMGIDLGISPIGHDLGVVLAKSNKISIVAIGGLLLGFFVSVAEPDLQILASQIAIVTLDALSSQTIVLVVSAGIAIMLMLGFIRMLYHFSLQTFLLLAYGLILILALFTSKEFLAISFDASGATTGALTVPFILTMSRGIAALNKNSKNAEEDSFGLVAIASTGAILAVLLLSIVKGLSSISGTAAIDLSVDQRILFPFVHEFPILFKESVIALLPITLIFLAVNAFKIHRPRRQLLKILVGLAYTLLGLTLFLLGVNAGFMQVGSLIGFHLVTLGSIYPLIVAFFLGMVTILAEPAVHILTHQIEDVTSGYVKRRSVLVTLSLGVALALLLSILRILVPSIQLWHYLLPGYVLSLVLALIVPKLFIGMAFDAGGVASGPMTATFILSFAQGVASAVEGANVLLDGFGIIATVAMTPIVALLSLGLIFHLKSKQS